MIKKTFKEIATFNGMGQGFLRRKPTNPQTKLGYAVTKLLDGDVAKCIKEYQRYYQDFWFENLEKELINNALTDKETGALLLNPNNTKEHPDRKYLYDKAGELKVREAERTFEALWETENEKYEKKELEIKEHLVTDLPLDLSAGEKEAFDGFVLNKSDIPEVIELKVETTPEPQKVEATGTPTTPKEN